MIDTKGLHPVVIGCTGGSGSRALRDILEASPQIFLDQDYSPHSKDSRKSKTFLECADAPVETTRRLIEEFMISVLDQIPAGNEVDYKYFGWKNPRNILVVEVLFQIHPGMRFLHLLRDPAAIARGGLWKKGYKRRKAKGKIDSNADPDEIILRRWARQNLPVWKKFQSHPGYLLVRYEDLITKPEKTVQAIFGGLGIVEFNMSKALAAIVPPEDAIERGDDVDISIIAGAAQQLGYAHRLGAIL